MRMSEKKTTTARGNERRFHRSKFKNQILRRCVKADGG
jgi:hypothetical protein